MRPGIATTAPGALAWQAMVVLVEQWALGERGALAAHPVPWPLLVGPNHGVLEALFRDRTTTDPRPIEVGDIVRLPGVGRFVAIASAWAHVPEGWMPPLDPDARPRDESFWVLPAESVIVHPDDPPGTEPFRPKLSRARRARTPAEPTPPAPVIAPMLFLGARPSPPSRPARSHEAFAPMRPRRPTGALTSAKARLRVTPDALPHRLREANRRGPRRKTTGA